MRVFDYPTLTIFVPKRMLKNVLYIKYIVDTLTQKCNFDHCQHLTVISQANENLNNLIR